MVAATQQKNNKKKKQKRYSKHNEQLQHYTRYHYTLLTTQLFHRSNLVTHFSYIYNRTIETPLATRWRDMRRLEIYILITQLADNRRNRPFSL